MDSALDFHDWELLLSPTSGGDTPKHTSGADFAIHGGGDDDAGAIKHDYFALDSDSKYPKRASSANSDDSDSGPDHLAASANPSWVDPDSDHLAFPDPKTPPFWSDTSSDEPTSPLFAVSDAYSEETGELEQEEAAKKKGDDVVVGKRGGEVVVRWWKVPFEMVKLWASKARPTWSVSIAVAVLGIAMLGRRLYRMRRQSKEISRVKLVLDEKKASQVKTQVARLNEAFSVVRRAPIMKPALPANGVMPWPVMGFL